MKMLSCLEFQSPDSTLPHTSSVLLHWGNLVCWDSLLSVSPLKCFCRLSLPFASLPAPQNGRALRTGVQRAQCAEPSGNAQWQSPAQELLHLLCRAKLSVCLGISPSLEPSFPFCHCYPTPFPPPPLPHTVKSFCVVPIHSLSSREYLFPHGGSGKLQQSFAVFKHSPFPF